MIEKVSLNECMSPSWLAFAPKLDHENLLYFCKALDKQTPRAKYKHNINKVLIILFYLVINDII